MKISFENGRHECARAHLPAPFTRRCLNMHSKSQAALSTPCTNVTHEQSTPTCCSDGKQQRFRRRHLSRHERLGRNHHQTHCERDNYPHQAPVLPPSRSLSTYLDDNDTRGARHSATNARLALRRSGSNKFACVISPSSLVLIFSLAYICCYSALIIGSLAAATPPVAIGVEYGAIDGGGVERVRQPAGLETDGPRAETLRVRLGTSARAPAPDEKLNVNASNAFEIIFKKRPYSKYWTIEQKWDDLFKRLIAVQGTFKEMMMKNFLRDIEYYADLSISAQCEKDLKFIQNYGRLSSNFRWLSHMFDSTGKSEPGMLTGQLAQMGHPVQCIKVRAPAKLSNSTFDEQYFEQQTRVLGERFRGKYCLASIRPVMPKRPHLVSRFSELMNDSLLSNISYMGEPVISIKRRARQMSVPLEAHLAIDRHHLRLDQVPFESELYEYMIRQRNFLFTLPRFTGVCYPSSCTRDDVRISLQKTFDDQHQVVDMEFECEQEEIDAWQWFVTPRLVAYVLFTLIAGFVFLASLTRYILLSKMRVNRARLHPAGPMASFLNVLDMFSMDKCAGILFIKTHRASPLVDWKHVENNRSTAIDALRGLLILVLIYGQLSLLGCLPLPFMWSKWSDAMFPFFRSIVTQLFININIWSEAFYIISAYLIALKYFENFRPKPGAQFGPLGSRIRLPDFVSFALKRYIRLSMPMLAFILLNYIWPRLSNGFVFKDQADKLMKPCDTSGWTNMLLFHNNHQQANETCLWPSHVSAAFFQLHLLSYPLIVICLVSLWVQFNDQFDNQGKLVRRRGLLIKLLTVVSFGSLGAIALLGAIYAARQASREALIVPFLVDYIDYDNYRRVIEWMVMPTYNHLTSYMAGMGLAFIVIRRKARNELRQLEAPEWLVGAGSPPAGHNEHEDSLSSIRSSSTQELQDGLTFKAPAKNKFILSSGPPSISASSHLGADCAKEAEPSGSELGPEDEEGAKTDASLEIQRHRSGGWWTFCKSSLCLVAMLVSLLASWYWNGLGQPMSTEQTFWYVLLTKLCFTLTFAYLFHEHFATKRNSSNPWMLTRFLVPIGRMSLTVFYTSWLVIWFDLLSSLYQWHPSHYFLFEKYNEIIFITLIVAMFVYGAFEGAIKRVAYAARLERVRRDQAELANNELQVGLDKSPYGAVGNKLLAAMRHRQTSNEPQRPIRVKPFESFFDALDKTSSGGRDEKRQQQQPACQVGDGKQSQAATGPTTGTQAADADQANRQPGGSPTGYANLTPSDRYKLNAELRANYSFASIGLYETAGATGDLSNLNAAHPDPQASWPANSQRR